MPTIYQASAQKKKLVKQSKTTPSSAVVHHSTVRPLTYFAVNPTGIRFETQTQEEEVILFLRQHVVVNVPWLLLSVVLLVAPTLLFPFFIAMLKLPIVIPVGYMIVGTLFWYLATFGFMLGNFLHWFFNIYIVTNERVVDIDFKYLLYKEFSEAELSKIQDLNYTTGGIFATIFNYGTVLVETAGELPNIEFESVPYPEKVVETISALAKR